MKLPSDFQAVGGQLSFRHRLGLILLLGLTIRLLLLATPRAYFPDEIFQYLEPAHRLVFGQGVVTWEYRYGIRSWLLPLILAGPMAVGNWMAPASAAYLVLPKLLIVAISLLEILAAGEIGRKLSPSHGLFAAFVMAIWSEAAFFGTQALTEAVAVAIFLPGAALLYDRKRHGPGMLALAGALIAFAAILRFQYAPAIGLFVLLRCGWDRRRWIWILLGAACALALSALVDISMGQTPFGWIFENLRQNISNGRALAYGPSSPLLYLSMPLSYWGYWIAPIILLACMGARRFPALMLAGLANIAAHELIAHKEYRYILLSTTLFVLLAAVGTVDLVRAVWRTENNRPPLLAAAIAWLSASVMVASSPTWAWHWAAATPKLEAFAALRTEPGLCGVGIYGFRWSLTGGYAYLNRPVPLYVPQNSTELASTNSGFNTIVAPPNTHDLPAAFREERCFGLDGRFPAHAVCIYRRPGACDPQSAGAVEINHYLRAIDR